MSNNVNKTKDLGDAVITRRRMLMKLGLAAGAIYAAPVLMQLSEARAVSHPSRVSGPDRRDRRGRTDWTRSSFSRSGRRRVQQPLQPQTYPDGRIRVGSFSR